MSIICNNLPISSTHVPLWLNDSAAGDLSSKFCFFEPEVQPEKQNVALEIAQSKRKRKRPDQPVIFQSDAMGALVCPSKYNTSIEQENLTPKQPGKSKMNHFYMMSSSMSHCLWRHHFRILYSKTKRRRTTKGAANATNDVSTKSYFFWACSQRTWSVLCCKYF